MSHELRPAKPSDADRVSALVDNAYRHYIERIGRTPMPMTLDYSEVIANCEVTVAANGDELVGVLVLDTTEEGFVIENVAVHPSRQGTGLGRELLELAEAEARRAGFDSLYLYTHELMSENLALYERIGYVEYERRPKFDFEVVFLRKQLP